MDYTALVSVLYFFKIDNLSYLLHILAFFTVCVLLFFLLLFLLPLFSIDISSSRQRATNAGPEKHEA